MLGSHVLKRPMKLSRGDKQTGEHSEILRSKVRDKSEVQREISCRIHCHTLGHLKKSVFPVQQVARMTATREVGRKNLTFFFSL